MLKDNEGQATRNSTTTQYAASGEGTTSKRRLGVGGWASIQGTLWPIFYRYQRLSSSASYALQAKAYSHQRRTDGPLPVQTELGVL